MNQPGTQIEKLQRMFLIILNIFKKKDKAILFATHNRELANMAD